MGKLIKPKFDGIDRMRVKHAVELSVSEINLAMAKQLALKYGLQGIAIGFCLGLCIGAYIAHLILTW